MLSYYYTVNKHNTAYLLVYYIITIKLHNKISHHLSLVKLLLNVFIVITIIIHHYLWDTPSSIPSLQKRWNEYAAYEWYDMYVVHTQSPSSSSTSTQFSNLPFFYLKVSVCWKRITNTLCICGNYRLTESGSGECGDETVFNAIWIFIMYFESIFCNFAYNGALRNSYCYADYIIASKYPKCVSNWNWK